MRIVITGYSGFIGRNVLSRVLELQLAERVLCLSRTAPPVASPIVETASVDLSDVNAHKLESLLEQFAPDAVVHCAGNIPSDPFKDGKGGGHSGMLRGSIVEATRHNVFATSCFLDVLSRVVPGVRFIHIGTAAEYGQVVTTDRSIDETCLVPPVSIYGITKLAATQLAIAFGRQKNIRSTVLRIFNPIGADVPKATLVGRALTMLNDSVVHEQGTLTFDWLGGFRDFIDIRDVVSAIISTLQESEKSVGQIINVGSGHAVCVRDVIVQLLREVSSHLQVRELATPQIRLGQLDWSQADISKAKTVLGWVPQYTLKETLQHVIATRFYRSGLGKIDG